MHNVACVPWGQWASECGKDFVSYGSANSVTRLATLTEIDCIAVIDDSAALSRRLAPSQVPLRNHCSHDEEVPIFVFSNEFAQVNSRTYNAYLALNFDFVRSIRPLRR
jgi:hypothetical protein